jgi:regulator of sirC expression with transglutaminase-like and TPR domain
MTLSLDESPARRRFAELVARPAIPLAEAALAIAQEEYPDISASAYLRRLDEFASSVDARLPSRRNAAAILRALRAVLFEEGGFRGNAEAYYDPRNSFLNEVLDRRLGIPISLSALYIEVASRVGLTVQGVGFPGHFLVKHVAGQREVFIDPFRGGEVFSAEDCAVRLQQVAPGRVLDPRYLDAVSTPQILRRMLHNLQRIYSELGDHVRALWVVDRLLLLAPEDLAARRDRGLLEARLGGTAAALSDLEAYLAREPGAPDADALRELVARLKSRGARFLN